MTRINPSLTTTSLLCSLFSSSLVTAPCLAQDAHVDAASSWAQWRGPMQNGEAPLANPPIEWSEDKNIRWKVELPGSGHGSPIIWKDHVFVTTAIPYGEAVDPVADDAPGAHDNTLVTRRQEYALIALDRATGKVRWHRTLKKTLPHAGAHRSGTLASASPVTDGQHVFAFFGSEGLFAMDLKGEVVWEKDLGKMSVKHGHGEGSSPVLFGDTIAINWDHEGKSFVAAYDKATGKERWRKARDEVTSWATPIAIEHEGVVQLIVSGTERVRAYDLKTGDVIWECGGLSHNIVASPVAADGIVILSSSYEKKSMFAVRLKGAEGDITKSDSVIWSRRRGTPYVPSPLLYRGAVYFLNHYQGVLTRVQASSGKQPQAPVRLGVRFSTYYASPVGADGRVYITAREGTTVVISGGDEPEFRFLARNELDDRFSASAALVDKELFLRGERYLYCIAEPVEKADKR